MPSFVEVQQCLGVFQREAGIFAQGQFAQKNVKKPNLTHTNVT